MVNGRSHRASIFKLSRCQYVSGMADDATGRDSDKFMLRLPNGMRDRLKAEAEANKRSMNAEIVARIEESFQGSYVTNEDPNFEKFLSQPNLTSDDLVDQIKLLHKNNSIAIANLINAFQDRIGLDITTVKRKSSSDRGDKNPES